MNTEVQAYIDSVADARRELFLKLHDIIQQNFPEAAGKISYQIVGYKVKNGWVYLGYWKQGVSIHVGYLPMLADFKAKYPKIKAGKGCINLKLKDEIPWEFIEQVIIKAMRESAKQ